MNTNILTIEQFERAKKRLHKSLQQHNTSTPLHQCADILAQTLGCRNYHEAQIHFKNLETATSETIKPKNTPVKHIIDLLEHFTPQQDERIEWGVRAAGGQQKILCLNVCRRSKKHQGDEEGFGLFFENKNEHNYQYLEKEFKYVDLSLGAQELLKTIRSIILEQPFFEREMLGWKCLAAVHSFSDQQIEKIVYGPEHLLPLFPIQAGNPKFKV